MRNKVLFPELFRPTKIVIGLTAKFATLEKRRIFLMDSDEIVTRHLFGRNEQVNSVL